VSRLYPRNRDLSRPLESVELRVEKGEEGRFDHFLALHVPWRPRAGLRRLIDEGRARLNGERRKASTRLRAGDVVTVQVRRDPPARPPSRPEVRILYEDEHLMALDKQAGVVVHPVGTHQEGTLLQALHERAEGGVLPKLAHRLDQHTSGVLLVARSDAVRAALSDQLEQGAVRKLYAALLLGRLVSDEVIVDAPLAPVGDSRILMQVNESGGKTAHSVFAVEERFDHATHASVRIRTGRTHQIRVHAAHLGHPLLGDHLYGDGIPLEGFESFALHARSIELRHPITLEALRIDAPLPEAFRDGLERLRAAGR
jgi:23S rRNA pseudouridine1911/1915/1917 synthase